MATRLFAVDPTAPDPAIIRQAAALLHSGGLVAFPTETVYGLGASGLSPDAVRRIYEAKGRPAWNPVIQHVGTRDQAEKLVSSWPERAEILAAHFWPGPLTLVLGKSAVVPDIATGGLDTTAVRMPAHPVALALLREFGAPVAAPSANRFTRISPTTAQHVAESLGARVDMILDGGACPVGIESTVVDLTAPVVTILRPGMIGKEAIEAVLGEPVQVADTHVKTRGRLPDASAIGTEEQSPAGNAGDGEESIQPAVRSPGQFVRHYSPRTDTWLVGPADTREVRNLMSEYAASGKRIAAVCQDPAFAERCALPNESLVILMPEAPAEYASRIYAALHDADASGVHVILIEALPTTGEWDAIRDRLNRAAAIS